MERGSGGTVTQKDLFGSAAAAPPKIRAYLLKKEPEQSTPAPPAEPTARQRVGFDVKVHMAAGRTAAPGTRYCFEHEKWEYQVAIYLDGRRWVFYCAEAARERGAKKYTGNPNKPTEE
jgi:hypothetical protein